MSNRFRSAWLAGSFLVTAMACGQPSGPSDSGSGGGAATGGGSAAGGGAATGGGGSATGGGTGGGTALPVTVRNVPSGQACQRASYISPVLPDEAGHWVATKVIPPSYPFRVTELAYGLASGPSVFAHCRHALSHRLRGYVVPLAHSLSDGGTAGTPPPATPGSVTGSIAFEQTVSTVTTEAAPTLLGFDGGVRGKNVTVSLDTPVTLQAGQALYVSIEMASGNGPAEDGGVDLLPDGGLAPNLSLCLEACRFSLDGGAAPLPEVDYWSNAAQEPYAWADMIVDFGYPGLFTIRAIGTPTP